MIDSVVLYLEDVSQTATQDTVDTQVPVCGEILAIELDLSGAASPNVDIDVLEIDKDGNTLQTIYSADDVTADAVVYPRVPAQDVGGTAVTFDGTNEIYVPFVVSGSKLRLSCGDSDKASVNLTAKIVFKS